MARSYQAMEEADRQYDGSLRSASRPGGRRGGGFRGAGPARGDAQRPLSGPGRRPGSEDGRIQRLHAPDCGGSHCGSLRGTARSAADLPAAGGAFSGPDGAGAAGGGGHWPGHWGPASLSGAEGGCQAEVGSASAMAAGLWCSSGGEAAARFWRGPPWPFRP